MKNSKCAIANKNIQNGGPSRQVPKIEEDKKRTRTPKKTLENQEDTDRDPGKAEN